MLPRILRRVQLGFRHILVRLYRLAVKAFRGKGLNKVWPIGEVHERVKLLLKRCARPEAVMVMGHVIYLDALDSLDLSTRGYHEKFETEIFQKTVRAGNVVVDLGANIGYYTLIAARLVGNSGKVFAFEPDPENFALLKKNVEANGYTNVVLVEKAVADVSGRTTLFFFSESKGGSMIHDAPGSSGSILVETVTLDDFFKSFRGDIHVIKMDVEGAERKVLRGMENVLRKNPGVKIFTEFQPGGLALCGTRPEEYLQALRNYGFRFYHINGEKEKLEPMEIEAILRLYSPVGTDCKNAGNFLCIRE